MSPGRGRPSADRPGSEKRARRRFLRALSGVGLAGVAGCLGSGDDENGSGDPDGEPVFDVSDLDPESADVAAGETVAVSATVTNTGDAEGTQDVAVRLDDEERASETVTLDPDGEEAVSFDVDTSGLEPGEYTHGVYSEDDDATGTLTVEGEDLMGTDPAVLVFSATDGFRHEEGIDAGNPVLEGMGQAMLDRHAADRATAAESVRIDVIDDPSGEGADFPADADELAEYDVVVWHNTTGSPLDDDQRAAFESYVENGGGYAGIHSAADTHYDWDWYGDLVGAYFENHPPGTHEAEIVVTDRAHPSTEHLPAVWERTDEWYDYDASPRGDVHVLATLDEDTYDGATMDDGRADHPISWCQEFEDGRSWYTGCGHTGASWDEDAFVDHAMNGIMWAAGWLPGDATGTVWDAYEKEVLESDLGEPMAMDLTPDGRLFYIQRSGRVGVIHPESGETATAAEFDVFSDHEDGGLGLAFDPDFEETGWVYVYYSPTLDSIDEPYDRLSRFELDGDELALDSEVELLQVPKQTDVHGHAGGDLAFDTDGNLYLTVGDDVTPFESDNYTPIDETQHEGWDAQGTSADTSDLRGKILRITPQDDGSYSVPAGNLKEVHEEAVGETFDEAVFKPEIYVMGCRNPFRASIDPETDWLYYGDYGPDAGAWDDQRGPLGIVEYNQIREPSFDGWPYFVGPNVPFVDYDFETGESGGFFDPENPINDSPNNGGLEELPAANPATMFTPYSWNTYLNPPNNYEDVVSHDQNPFPSLPGGGAPMSGVNYRNDEGHGDGALPASYDGKWFIMEYNHGWLKYVTMDEEGGVREIDDFLPDESWQNPFDMAIGPDGVLYVMEYGAGRISRIDR